jgi:formate dehydrogenase subunit gamma
MRSWDEAIARSLVEPHRLREGGLLPALQALVEVFGHVDARAMTLVADAFGVSRADVAGVVGFYTDLRRTPPGQRVVKVCRAEACQAVGAERLTMALVDRLGLAMDTTAPDGSLTLETVYCLGNCALGPAVLIDGSLHGRATAERVAGALGR